VTTLAYFQLIVEGEVEYPPHVVAHRSATDCCLLIHTEANVLSTTPSYEYRKEVVRDSPPGKLETHFVWHMDIVNYCLLNKGL
jgi:hypothetical protein